MKRMKQTGEMMNNCTLVVYLKSNKDPDPCVGESHVHANKGI